jgi:hypothetical protein
MADVEDRLRETLRRRARSVPARLDVPPDLVGRARTRIARNAVAGVALVAIVAVGTFTGVRALTGHSQGRVTATPAPTACSGANFSGRSNLMIPDGHEDVREGVLVLTNVGRAACWVRGSPIVKVLDRQGIPRLVGSGDLAPAWEVNRTGPPPDWPLITLQPGEQVQVRVQWKGCPNSHSEQTDPATWELRFPEGGGTTPVDVTRQDIPTCAHKEPQELKVGPFEPYTG